MHAEVMNLETRRRYAELLRRFVAGGLTTDGYEDLYRSLQDSRGRDSATEAIFHAVWHLYDDVWPHRMTGDHHLDKVMRKRIARWVLFLRSNERYDTDATQEFASSKRATKASPPPAYRRHLVIACVAAVPVVVCAVLLTAGNSAGFTLGLATLALLIATAMVALIVALSRPAVVSDEAEAAFASDPNIWPFTSTESFDHARISPTFLWRESTPGR